MERIVFTGNLGMAPDCAADRKKHIVAICGVTVNHALMFVQGAQTWIDTNDFDPGNLPP